MSQDKYTKSARNQSCTALIPGIHQEAPGNETTILAHFNGHRQGHKALNIHGCYCCYWCHSWLDGGYAKTHTREQRDLWHLEAIIKTQIIMVADGVLKL